jgi:hypothetical protein
MRYMQIVSATDPEAARRSYVELLQRQGISISESTDIYVEVVHRMRGKRGSWLCYVGSVSRRAA